MKVKNYIKIALIYISILFLYVFISFALWGFPINALNKVILGYSTDPIIFIWSFNWLKYAVVQGLNPFTSINILNPIGVNLTWSAGTPFGIMLLFLPITIQFGAIVSYNLCALLSPALSAFTMFVLGMYLTKNIFSSVFSGYIYGFSSYEIGQLIGHLHLFTVFLIPLIVLTCLLFYQNRMKKYSFWISFSFLLILQFGLSLEIFTTITLFGYISLISALIIVDNQDKKIIINLGAWITLSYITTIIFVSPFIYYLYKGLPFIPKVFNSADVFSADLLNYIIPTRNTWLGGNYFTNISTKFTGNSSEEGAYLGVPLIFMFFLYLKENYKKVETKIFATVLLIIVILSLGPILQIAGHKLMSLPWEVVLHIPLIKNTLPTRFPLYISLILAITISIWLSISTHRVFRYLIAILSVCFLMPNMKTLKSAIQQVNTPSFFTERLYTQYIEPHSNILIIPFSYPSQNNSSALWQVKSDMFFNMVDFPFPPVPLKKWNWLNSNIVANLIADTPNNVSCIDELKGFLGTNDVNYVIISSTENNKWGNIFSDMLGKPLAVGDIFLYKVPHDLLNKYNNYADVFAQCNLKQFAMLLAASQKYLQNDNQLVNLYPKYLEEHGYLDNLFGYHTGQAYNWTQNGGWIGEWGCPDGKGQCFGVGIVGDINELKPIIEKYSDQAKQIFLPYPEIYDPNLKEGSGQLLMIFSAE